jgi:EAL domain-containing protein (putative c-di-GMP-specific phosphodiesterase class I)
MVKGFGCHIAQGYLLGRPLLPEDSLALIWRCSDTAPAQPNVAAIA